MLDCLFLLPCSPYRLSILLVKRQSPSPLLELCIPRCHRKYIQDQQSFCKTTEQRWPLHRPSASRSSSVKETSAGSLLVRWPFLSAPPYNGIRKLRRLMEGTACSQVPKAYSQMGGKLISIKTGFVILREAEYKVLETQPSSLVMGRIKKCVREKLLRV